MLIRLSIWYTAFTILVRCPSSPSKLSPNSPALCEPYFKLRDVAVPHVQPYYDTYLAPYTEKVQPYVDRANSQVVVPAVTFARKYGGPRLTQARTYSQKEWNRTIRPQLHVASQHIGKQYDATLAPHVQKVEHRVMPLYNSARTSVLDFYELELLPAYKHTAPHAYRLYTQLSRFTTNTALPYASWTTNLTMTFVKRQIWPRLQVLYGENVEPQIFRISQRLGRYRDEKKIEAAAEDINRCVSASCPCHFHHESLADHQ